MRRSTGLAIASMVGVAAIAAPIMLSIRIAWNQSLSTEKSRTLSYAQDVLRRVDETAIQFEQAVDKLNNDHLSPCSPGELEIMHQIDLESSYIQAVGRVSGDTLVCTSLGTKAAIPIGPPELVTNRGVTERNNIQLVIAPSYNLSVMSRDGVAIVIDPSLAVDTPTEGPDIPIAIFVPSSPNRNLIARRGNILPRWLKIIPKGSQTTFIDGGYVVTEIRSPIHDYAVVAAVPEVYALRRAQQFALEFVPIGLLCGAGLAWAVLYISRIQLSMKSLIRNGARRGEFFTLYQPVVELESRRWVGAEALVRWKRNGTVVTPDLFIPNAEKCGIISVITAEVAKIVAKDLPKLIQLDSLFKVAINLSTEDATSEGTIFVLQQLLQDSGAHSFNLEVEVTERGFMEGEGVRKLLARIQKMGVSVSIDDFGTGYSSLSCLQTLSLDSLKIDKSFVDTINTDGVTSQVVLHIIDMAHALNLKIVAEGVETEAQAEFLRRRGVHYAQGWLFGRPMAIETFCERLVEQQALPESTAVAVY